MWFTIFVAFILLTVIFALLEREILFNISLLCVLGAGITSCSTSEWYKEHEREQELEARQRAIPRVIREIDGCKIYSFYTDREHYFTRCGTTVSTTTNWTRSCGKSCRKEESEVIVTEGNK